MLNTLRKRLDKFRDEWNAAGQALEAAQQRDARRRATEQRAKTARIEAGECDQDACINPAELNGKCRGCWSAIF